MKCFRKSDRFLNKYWSILEKIWSVLEKVEVLEEKIEALKEKLKCWKKRDGTVIKLKEIENWLKELKKVE